MPDVRRRDLGDAMGQAVAGIAGGLASGGSTAITQIRDITSTGRDRDLSGASVVGSSSVQTFTIDSPGSDGFTITLEGGPASEWQCTLSLEGESFAGETFILTPVMAGVSYPATTWSGGSGSPVGTAAATRTFHGGDEIICEAVLTGTGGTAEVTIDFSARPL